MNSLILGIILGCIPFIIAFTMLQIRGYFKSFFECQKVDVNINCRGCWVDISEIPVPNDLEQFIFTDGEIVKCYSSIRYNKFGQVIFHYDDKVATHWMALPTPPGKND